METYLIDYDMGDLLFVVTCDEGTAIEDVVSTAIIEIERNREYSVTVNMFDLEQRLEEYSLRCYQDNDPDFVLMGISPIKVVPVIPATRSLPITENISAYTLMTSANCTIQYRSFEEIFGVPITQFGASNDDNVGMLQDKLTFNLALFGKWIQERHPDYNLGDPVLFYQYGAKLKDAIEKYYGSEAAHLISQIITSSNVITSW